MSDIPVLINLSLPLIPSNLNLVKVPNLIEVNAKTNTFGKIQVNDNEWYLSHDPVNDFWWVNPRPEPKFYEILYTKLFYSSPISEQFGYASLEIDGTRRTEKAKKNWSDIYEHISIKNKGRLFEIGCGSGEFLLEAKNQGWHYVEGNELELQSAKLAIDKGLNIDTGFFENYQLNKKPLFDMLFADNVIEHTMNPILFLEKCNQILTKNGLLVLRLPDTQSFGPTLKLIDHTYHFTRKSIELFLNKAGFGNTIIFYSGTYKGSKFEMDPKQRIENMTVISHKI
ncbi:MAG: methyltransferase domain-containing protein [Bacteroidota bacterium]|nr:methyltransferase domain-containing protein [Bacteroidota bacterium]